MQKISTQFQILMQIILLGKKKKSYQISNLIKESKNNNKLGLQDQNKNSE